MGQQNYINHFAFDLDGSYSMLYRTKDVVQVVDNQVAYLAQRSKELDQETRITVYSFSGRNTAKCLIYDKDVLRMPSIAGLYKPDGLTALIDATLLSINDLAMTPEKYGEHAFCIYVLTDGAENDSFSKPALLKDKIAQLPDHWTIAAFVPNQIGVFEAKKFGFPADNIAIWDATTAKGVSEAGETIRKTTEQFMQNRTVGIRGTKSLFRLKTVSVQEIRDNMMPLTEGQYHLFKVAAEGRIDDTVGRLMRRPYQMGEAYYQLMKRETIQPQKDIAIVDKDGTVYIGRQARTLLGLPNEHVNVTPGNYPYYTIFVQSTSINRKLLAGTRLLVLK